MVITVPDVIDLKVSGLALPLSNKDGPVVCPAGEYSCRKRLFLLFGDPEERPVIIVRRKITVAEHIMLIGPDSCQHRVVPDSRNGGSLVVHSGLTSDIAGSESPGAGNVIDNRNMQSLNHILRNAVHDDDNRFLIFG